MVAGLTWNVVRLICPVSITDNSRRRAFGWRAMRRIIAAILFLFAASPSVADELAPYFVQLLQQQLLLHGYNSGPATGRLDARTRTAAESYRRDAGLPENTSLRTMLAHLQYAAPRVMAKRLTPSGPKPQVAAAQIMLRSLGYFDGPIDGMEGASTIDAVAGFRRDRKLHGAGIDEHVLELLRRASGQDLVRF